VPASFEILTFAGMPANAAHYRKQLLKVVHQHEVTSLLVHL
jgi:hypothetical protein